MKTNIFLFLSAFAILFVSCAEDKGPKEGELITDSYISEDEFKDFYFEISDEEELCKLIDMNVLTKHFPGAETYSTKGLGLSQYGMNNGGCSLSWVAEENIMRQKAGNYYHISSRGTVDVKYNVNPDTSYIDGFAHRPLKTKMNPEYKKGPDSLGLDSKYYKVDNVGSFAIWNDGSSSLAFALGEDVLFTIVIKYPKPNEERKEIARELAQALIRNLSTK